MFKTVSASEGLVQQMMKRHPGLQNWMNPSLPFFRKDTMLVVNMRNDKDDYTLPPAPISHPPLFVKKNTSSQKTSQEKEGKEKEEKKTHDKEDKKEKDLKNAPIAADTKEARPISGAEAAAKIGLKIGAAAPVSAAAPAISQVTAIQVASNAVNLKTHNDKPTRPMLTNSEMVSLYSDPLWGAQAAQDDIDNDRLNDLLSDVLGDAADLLDDDDDSGSDAIQVMSNLSPSPPSGIMQAPNRPQPPQPISHQAPPASQQQQQHPQQQQPTLQQQQQLLQQQLQQQLLQQQSPNPQLIQQLQQMQMHQQQQMLAHQQHMHMHPSQHHQLQQQQLQQMMAQQQLQQLQQMMAHQQQQQHHQQQQHMSPPPHHQFPPGMVRSVLTQEEFFALQHQQIQAGLRQAMAHQVAVPEGFNLQMIPQAQFAFPHQQQQRMVPSFQQPPQMQHHNQHHPNPNVTRIMSDKRKAPTPAPRKGIPSPAPAPEQPRPSPPPQPSQGSPAPPAVGGDGAKFNVGAAPFIPKQ